MKKIRRWLFGIFFLTLYLNFGWALGTYYHNNVTYTEPEGISAKILAGGWGLISEPDKPASDQNSLLEDQILMSIVWPIYILVVTVSWIFFGAYQVVWFISAGGLAKLLGVG